jgi:inhibitor of KinA
MDWRIRRLGDGALLLEFDDRIDSAVNMQVHALSKTVAELRLPWICDVVPAYSSLAIYLAANAFADADDPLVCAEEALRPLLSHASATRVASPERRVEIPVRYGGDDGPDLQRVAEHAKIAPEEVIRRHVASDYTVAMLGFAPGFPYLLGLDPQLATPRLATPRTRVPAGSVAIGGGQTGLYPHASPGGWNLIGRTDLVLFDPKRDPPTLLVPGDRVCFVAVAGP